MTEISPVTEFKRLCVSVWKSLFPDEAQGLNQLTKEGETCSVVIPSATTHVKGSTSGSGGGGRRRGKRLWFGTDNWQRRKIQRNLLFLFSRAAYIVLALSSNQVDDWLMQYYDVRLFSFNKTSKVLSCTERPLQWLDWRCDGQERRQTSDFPAQECARSNLDGPVRREFFCCSIAASFFFVLFFPPVWIHPPREECQVPTHTPFVRLALPPPTQHANDPWKHPAHVYREERISSCGTGR